MPVLTATPDTLDFGDVGLTTTATLTCQVACPESPTPLAVSLVSNTPQIFQPSSLTTIEPGTGSFQVTVVCTPKQLRTYAGKVTVAVGGHFVEVNLSARGVKSSMKARGAYLLLEVPDYGDTQYVNEQTPPDSVDDGLAAGSVPNDKLRSYLRLGAFDFASESASAKELLKVIPKSNAAIDPDGNEDTTDISDGDSGTLTNGIVFVDDVRTRPQDVAGLSIADDPDHGLTRQQRRDESAKLYSRGGWRDHSDGNRISTTWGDKVEVVRGNYKMIVMGRQNDPEQSMGWEASGAHIQDYAPGTMPGASFWLEWIDDSRYHIDGQKGVWLLVNTTENVYEYARNAGNFREEKWGDVFEEYVGSENPPASAYASDDLQGTKGHSPPHRLPGRHYDYPRTKDDRDTPPWASDNKDCVRSNPHIIEGTWAERIDAWTGSAGCLVPDIDERKWANRVYEETTIPGALIGNTRVAGALIEATSVAGAKIDCTTVAGPNLEFTFIVNAIPLPLPVPPLATGTHLEAYVNIGSHLVLDVSVLTVEVAAAPLKIEMAAGGILEIEKLKVELKEEEISTADLETKIANNVSALALDVKLLNSSYKNMTGGNKVNLSSQTTHMASNHTFL